MSFNEEKYALKIFKILANANRIKILRLLKVNASNRLSVNQLAELLHMEQGKVSNHLIRMRNDGILRAEQEGAYMYYRIKDPKITDALSLFI